MFLMPMVSTTSHPRDSANSLLSTLMPFFSAMSTMLRTTTMGIPRSATCSRRYRALSMLDASTMFMATSGLLSCVPMR